MPDNWDNMRKQLEYETLRAEALGYIRQYFDLMVIVVTASAVLFGFGFEQKNGAIFLCEYILLFLVISHWKTMDSGSSRISTYLRVFLGNDDSEGWSSRAAKLRLMEFGNKTEKGNANTDNSGLLKYLRIFSEALHKKWEAIQWLPRAYQPLYCALAVVASVAGFIYIRTYAFEIY